MHGPRRTQRRGAPNELHAQLDLAHGAVVGSLRSVAEPLEEGREQRDGREALLGREAFVVRQDRVIPALLPCRIIPCLWLGPGQRCELRKQQREA